MPRSVKTVHRSLSMGDGTPSPRSEYFSRDTPSSAARGDGIRDVSGQPQAEAVAYLPEAGAHLLSMAEVRSGEHRAAGGDLGRLAIVFESDFTELGAAGEAQPHGLLVQEAARARGAGGAGLEVAEAAEELGSRGGAGDAGDAAGRELGKGGPEALPDLALVEAVRGSENRPYAAIAARKSPQGGPAARDRVRTAAPMPVLPGPTS